jgi:hypothetical protein
MTEAGFPQEMIIKRRVGSIPQTRIGMVKKALLRDVGSWSRSAARGMTVGEAQTIGDRPSSTAAARQRRRGT